MGLIAWRSVVRHKGRSAFLALCVVIGVAFVAGRSTGPEHLSASVSSMPTIQRACSPARSWKLRCRYDPAMTSPKPTHDETHDHAHEHDGTAHSHAHTDHGHEHVEHDHEHQHGGEVHVHTHPHESGLEDHHEHSHD